MAAYFLTYIYLDRVPEELWAEVRNTVQEAVIKTIAKKKKCKKAKWLSEEALQIAEKRKEAKGKGEKERYTHLNAEFQRISRRDKKAFLSEQCKEIEENNRMGTPAHSPSSLGISESRTKAPAFLKGSPRVFKSQSASAIERAMIFQKWSLGVIH